MLHDIHGIVSQWFALKYRQERNTAPGFRIYTNVVNLIFTEWVALETSFERQIPNGKYFL